MGYSRSAGRLPTQLLLLAVLVSCGAVFMVSQVVAFSASDYADALDKSILFYDVQRSGKLPSFQRLSWRGDSAVNDGMTSSNVDLSGGYYDAGDNIKFGLPMAFSIALLSWSVVEFGDSLSKAGELGHAQDAIRWGTDYLLKANTGPTELWAQVGEPNSDHACWERTEEMDTPRKAYKVDASNPGSDVAGETAAALAAASIVFQTTDPAYSGQLLSSAKQVFDFADKYRGKYSDVLSSAVCPFYCSYSGYEDELVWGAAWLYKASRDNKYLQYLVSNGVSFAGTTTSVNSLDWDNKYAGAQVLIARVVLSGNSSNLQGYKDRADDFICGVLPSSISSTSQSTITPGGLIFHDGGSNMQYVTSSALLLTTYAKYLSSASATLSCGSSKVTSTQLFSFAQQQVDYILGKNPKSMSYMVGFGSTFPKQVHHRGSSLPSMKDHPSKISCNDGFTYYKSTSPNLNEATGAVLGGPDKSDSLNDVRSNYQQMEPTTYINAPLVGVLAVLAAGATF